jgi:hypothetical protein
LKWAANYIEEQQTQLILSLFNNNAEKATNNDDNEQQNKEDDYKSLGSSLEAMGIGKSFINDLYNGLCFFLNFVSEPVTTSLNYSTDNLNSSTLDLPEWHPSIDLSNEDLDLTGIDDNEIEEMILTRDETKLKLKSWLRENKDWFLEEKRRQRNKEAAEQNKTGSSGITAAQRRKRKKKTASNELNKSTINTTSHHGQLAGLVAAAHSALEAEKHSQDKRISSKINYDVLKRLTVKQDETGQVPSSPAITNTNEAERTT